MATAESDLPPRGVMVESQPPSGPARVWRVVDAVDGALTEGKTAISPRHVRPRPSGASAPALRRGRAGAETA